ncbi:MAG TPA: serine/threonine-protein kinase, partial [Burkholderiaceae bacterium]|nr:serine/threonine-protein kinase [Burkholderiaceae bacterium]
MVGVGQRIGNYRVLRKLGQGGMGAVYEAVQEEIGRRAAIKVLLPDFAKDQQSILRFFNEARAVNIIHHPGLVGVFESGRLDDGAAYIVMEYLSGELLTARLEKAGQLAHPDAINISRQIASALRAAHEKGIVHRDLKPDNVMLVPDPHDPRLDHVKVLDFGIAKVLERDKAPSPGPESSSDEAPSSLVASALTTVGVVVGTPAYMSPEQCRAEPVDARSDVYSCGILLYQLVCGRTPFTGDSPIEIAINQVRMPPDPPSTIVPGIHPQLEQIMLKA